MKKIPLNLVVSEVCHSALFFLRLKVSRPWEGPAMSSTLAVRGPGFPEAPPKKVGSREHWEKLGFLNLHLYGSRRHVYKGVTFGIHSGSKTPLAAEQ